MDTHSPHEENTHHHVLFSDALSDIKTQIGANRPVIPRKSIMQKTKKIPRSVALADPVKEAATIAMESIQTMLGSIKDVQGKMLELDLQSKPIQSVTSTPPDPSRSLANQKGGRKAKRREQIIGESLDNDVIDLEIIPKSDETRQCLEITLQNHFLFSDLEPEGVKDVIDTMVQDEALAGMVIIAQGESGEKEDKFYVLEHGRAQIKVNGESKGFIEPGSAFGELALMWNSPRAATIIATEDCSLWTLSRPLFRRLLATTSSNQTVMLCNFLKNVDLLKPLGNQETTKIARALHAAIFNDGEKIITQGDEGEIFYMIYKGTVICTRTEEDGHERELIRLGPGEFFGERALQKREKRAANCIAHGDVECFTLSLEQFDLLLGSIQDLMYQITTSRVLKGIKMLQGLSDEALYTLTTFFERNTFNEGDYVIEEGTEGDHFYVVHAGSVSVTQFSSSLNSSVELEILGSGQYFGEMALLRRVPRTATVQVTSKTAELLVMHREAFQTFMAPFEQQLQEEMAMREASTSSKKADLHGDDKMIAESFPSLMQTQGFAGSGRSRNESMAIAIEKKQADMDQVVLEDLEVQGTLGTGTFGKVVMVKHKKTGEVSALKCLAKAHLIRTQQQQNVRREKTAMQIMDHPFIVELRGTLSDSNQVYLLLEYVAAGELWTLIYERRPESCKGQWGGLSLRSAMLYSAMCVSAFEHIHNWYFCYRDLKPENLLVDEFGYLKIADFGFAKKIPYELHGKTEDRTFTLCGTPEYMAPEIVLSRGHDKAVDYWACGILIYEMLCGATPFEADSQQETFERIVYSQRYLRFPLGFDPHAKSLIRKLLESNSALRLGSLRNGIEDIKDHLFFSAHNLDWDQLYQRDIPVEWKPSSDEKVEFIDGEEVDIMGDTVEEFQGGEEDPFADF